MAEHAVALGAVAAPGPSRALITALSIATLLVGFAVTIPVIGHASWRAYVATVDSAAAPPRE